MSAKGLKIQLHSNCRYNYCTISFYTWQTSPQTHFLPESMRAMPPQALGDDIEVPFINCVPRSVQLGTDAMAPPGALMLTPRAPSVLGPLEDQVYWFGGSFSLREYSATIMSGVTYAPTPEDSAGDSKTGDKGIVRLQGGSFNCF